CSSERAKRFPGLFVIPSRCFQCYLCDTVSWADIDHCSLKPSIQRKTRPLPLARSDSFSASNPVNPNPLSPQASEINKVRGANRPFVQDAKYLPRRWNFRSGTFTLSDINHTFAQLCWSVIHHDTSWLQGL
ncbi:ser thr protein phosphatase family protein, partial [Moniliophthora roreri]